MLIYNHQKEFIGIDEEDLKTLGFSNLSQLRAESADFADLFVRTPGYIHNFKHVHWIDFVACADPSESSRVIIDVNGKTLKASISIETLFLTDNPSSKAYLVRLNNLKALSSEETENISEELASRPMPAAAVEPVVVQEPVKEVFVQEETPVQTPVQEDFSTPLAMDIDDFDLPEEEAQEELIPDSFELNETPSFEDEIPQSIEIDGFDFDDEEEEEEPVVVADEPAVQTQEEIIDENFDYDYKYDPQVASDELGLPIDLIEEFIQDFIAQSHEFKEGLYNALDADDLDNVKILSHKLKGVAANLRIEDAFNTLSIINTSEDTVEIRSHLATFYKIIAKLSGEEIKAVETPLADTTKEISLDISEPQEDLYQDHEEINLADEIEIELETSEKEPQEEPLDEDVPQTIEMPELADDDFLQIETDLEDIDDLDLNVEEDIELEVEKDVLDLEMELQEEAEAQDIVLKEDPTEEVSAILEYSKEQVASEIGLDEETFQELFKDFATESIKATQSIEQALNEDNLAKAQKEIIKLKGMSENMRITNYNQELEILTSSSNKDERIDALKRIETIIQEISK
jgi:HPt (histidine-containing phosphotransfer) domain-containing protein